MRVTGTATKIVYKPFTRANARHNLIMRTGKNMANCQAHHVLPVKFEDRFAKAGINIHEPQHLIWWISTKGVAGNHPSMAAEYNRLWAQFFETHQNPSKLLIMAYRTAMVARFASRYRC